MQRTPAPTTGPGERLQRILADAGVGSRRACEEMIEAGRVEVNGEIVRTLPVFAHPGVDRIHVDGRPVKTIAPGAGRLGSVGRGVYVMLYKPARTVCTTSDEYGRRTVLDLVDHPTGARLFPVGRLDYEAAGLLLLTNDGDMAHRLTHARYGIARRYLVEVGGTVEAEKLPKIEKEATRIGRLAARSERKAAGRTPDGPDLKKGRVGMRVVKVPGQGERKTILEVTLAEGRNRQVGVVLKRAGYGVKKVLCVGLGPLSLKGLAVGQWRELDRTEVRTLKKAVGLGDDRKPAAAGNRHKSTKPAPAKVPSNGRSR
ncbi:MAG: rRNA pseudouridine synthase [Phycisphaeraceae bacterium]|nr:rRNA pseudouridine synthase [Phycisphaeraceae bacterium]